MSYNGTGTFNINTAGQPVVTGTVISSTAFNALTADLATGLSTAITKDGQTTVTANIPFNNFKLTGIAAATATGDALSYGRAATVTTLVASTSITDSGLTSGRVTYAGTAGLLQDSANLTFDGTSLTLGGNPTLSAGTANGVGYLNGSKVLTTGSALTFDGTTLTANALSVTNGVTLSAGTANGVLYLNGSKVATSGSALTFDGTTFATTARTSSANGAWVGSGAVMGWGAAGTFSNYIVGDTTSNYLLFQVNSAEGMRLTSTGLGIGTSSPGSKLDVQNSISTAYSASSGSTAIARVYNTYGGAGNTMAMVSYADANYSSAWYVGLVENGAGAYTGDFVWQNRTGASSYAEALRLTSSGNLGLGVTPSAWGQGRAFELLEQGYGLWNGTGSSYVLANTYYNGNFKYANTGAAASHYYQYQGAHVWSTAPSGTAGNPITFTQAMTLNASGNLLLGATSSFGPAYKLQIYNSATTENRIHLTHSGSGNTQNDGLLVGLVNSESYIFNYENGALIFGTNNGERARIDPSGNLGLGVTPSGWGGSYKAIELPGISVANLNGGTNQQAQYLLNAYDSGAGAWKYKITGVSAAMYRQAADASHEWHLAPSGTAGNPITFTQAMTLDSSGNLLVGTTGATYSSSGRGVIELNGASDNIFAMKLAGSQNFYIQSNGTSSSFWNVGGTYMNFGTNNTERARITSGGTFLIAQTADDNWTLQVNGGGTQLRWNYARASYSSIFGFAEHRGDSGGVEIGNINSSTDQSIRFSNGSSYSGRTERARITSGGNLLVGLTSDSSYGTLQVNAGSNRFFEVGGSGSTRLRLSSTDAGYLIGYRFSQNNGTEIASIEASGNATSGNSVTDNSIKFNNLGSERARIDSSGNLLVGTTSTSSLGASGRGLIELSGSSDCAFGMKVGTTLYGYLYNAASEFRVANVTANPITFHTNNTERARIDSSGQFQVSSSLAGSNLLSCTNSSATGYGISMIVNNDSSGTYRYFEGYSASASTQRIAIYTNGDVKNSNNSYGALSDAKLKQDIVDAGSQWDDIKALRVRKYRFKDQPDGALHIGLIAQEAEVVSPGLVTEHQDESRNEDGSIELLDTTTKSLKYSVLYMKAIKALQEAMARIEQLETKVAALESK